MEKHFAYYYHAYPVRGTTVANFRQDIAEAQAIGIDGFLLGYHGWYSSGVNYVGQVANMFRAAEGTGFKLALAPIAVSSPFGQADCTIPWNLYRDHPNHLRINGRPVFVPYGGGGQSTEFWVTTKAAMPGNPLFMPYYGFFHEDPPRSGPTLAEIEKEWAWRGLARFVDGLTHFSTAGTTSDAIAAEAAYVSFARAKGMPVLAGVKPYFWIGRLLGNPGRIYYEDNGGEGIAAQFAGLRALNIQYTVITSWNDMTEGVLTPAPPAERLRTSLNVDALQLPTEGAYRLTGFHIKWTDQTTQPGMDDSLFVFYRTHPNAAVPTNDPAPVIKVGTITDSIYVTTHCVTAAELRYNDGAPLSVAAGIVNTRIPFMPGARQNIKLRRGSTIVREINGVPIVAHPAKYNYFVASFYDGPR